MTRVLLLSVLLVLLVGCAPDAGVGAEFDSETTSGVGGSSSGSSVGPITGRGGGSATNTSEFTDTTTGAAGSAGSAGIGGNDGPAGAASTAGGADCSPPTAFPELEQLTFDGASYAAESRTLCGGGSGVVRCSESPCLSVGLEVSVTPWSDDGMTLKVTYAAQEPWLVPMAHDCGNVVYECNKIADIPYEQSYLLALVQLPDGFAVKGFYLVGDEPGDAPTNLLQAGQSYNGMTLREVAPEVCAADYNFNYALDEAWREYTQHVNTLEWDCEGELR